MQGQADEVHPVRDDAESGSPLGVYQTALYTLLLLSSSKPGSEDQCGEPKTLSKDQRRCQIKNRKKEFPG